MDLWGITLKPTIAIPRGSHCPPKLCLDQTATETLRQVSPTETPQGHLLPSNTFCPPDFKQGNTLDCKTPAFAIKYPSNDCHPTHSTQGTHRCMLAQPTLPPTKSLSTLQAQLKREPSRHSKTASLLCINVYTQELLNNCKRQSKHRTLARTVKRIIICSNIHKGPSTDLSASDIRNCPSHRPCHRTQLSIPAYLATREVKTTAILHKLANPDVNLWQPLPERHFTLRNLATVCERLPAHFQQVHKPTTTTAFDAMADGSPRLRVSCCLTRFVTRNITLLLIQETDTKRDKHNCINAKG